jgi:hypothetical protein
MSEFKNIGVDDGIAKQSGSESIDSLFGISKPSPDASISIEPTALADIATYSTTIALMLIPIGLAWLWGREIVHAAEHGRIANLSHWRLFWAIIAAIMAIPMPGLNYMSPAQVMVLEAVRKSSDLADKQAQYFGEVMSLSPNESEPPMFGLNPAVSTALQILVCQATYGPHDGKMGLSTDDEGKLIAAIDWRTDYLEHCGSVNFPALDHTGARPEMESAVRQLYADLAPVAVWVSAHRPPGTVDEQAEIVRTARDRFESSVRAAARKSAASNSGIEGWKQLGVIHREIAQLDRKSNAAAQMALHSMSFSMPVTASEMVRKHYQLHLGGGDTGWSTLAWAFSQSETITSLAFSGDSVSLTGNSHNNQPIELNISQFCSIRGCDIDAAKQHVADWMTSNVLVDPPSDLMEKDPIVRMQRKGQRFEAAAETLLSASITIAAFNSVPVVGDAGAVLARRLEDLADKLIMTRNVLVDWFPQVPYTVYTLIIGSWYLSVVISVFVTPLVLGVIVAGYWRLAWAGAGMIIYSIALPHLAASGMSVALIIARRMFAEVYGTFGLSANLENVTGLWSASAIIAAYVFTMLVVHAESNVINEDWE